MCKIKYTGSCKNEGIVLKMMFSFNEVIESMKQLNLLCLFIPVIPNAFRIGASILTHYG